MPEAEIIDYEKERDKDTKLILDSPHKKKVVLAGPGTGKSHLLEEAIKIKKKQGKTKFHAITFIGKLGDALADDLAGLAETTTLHGFAREFVLKHRSKEWVYFPRIKDIILEDLKTQGKENVKVGDSDYIERTKYYRAVGDDDVVYYAVQMCKEDKSKIPVLDLLLIDEFQDFNEIENEFICILADKNEILIVGDDDQALYKWKDAHPKYIREKHDESNSEYESHTLRWCTRCPEVIINAFHDIVAHYSDELQGRKDKEYLCYYPAKKEDNALNPKILVMRSQYVSIAQNIRYELEKILNDQKIKSVLIVGEGMSCGGSMLPSIARVLKEVGFRNVDHKSGDNKPFSLNQNMVDAYRILKRQKNLPLAWRLIAEKLPDNQMLQKVTEHFLDSGAFISSLPEQFRKDHEFNANTLGKIIKGPNSARAGIAGSSMKKLQDTIVDSKKEDRELLTGQLITENHHLKRPLANLDITVCSIIGSKGLGADVVFLVGFDQKKLPAQQQPTDEEIYQMLVALTRTKKRLYLVNTIGCGISGFLSAMGQDRHAAVQ